MTSENERCCASCTAPSASTTAATPTRRACRTRSPRRGVWRPTSPCRQTREASEEEPPMTTLTYTGELTVLTCWCGMRHAVPVELHNFQKRQHADGRKVQG